MHFLCFSEAAGNPDSICCIPTSSNFLAIFSLSSMVKTTPGVCSPSLKVLSCTMYSSIEGGL